MMFRFISTAFLLFALCFQASTAQDSYLDEVVKHHADLALISFQETYKSAQHLQNQVGLFIVNPNEANLLLAKQAWIAARDLYSQTETFRFGHPPVDEWEVQVNAWPLDEGLIDYVDIDQYYYELSNAYGQINLIANADAELGASGVTAQNLTPEFLASINEIGGSEANVATGWHAIEFLLWGQDLNGTGPGAGQRPASDYARDDNCTHGHCDRRAQYLASVTDLLVEDLAYIVEQWQPNRTDNYRAEFKSLPQQEQLRRILYSLGSLSLGELAGERMRVALFANSTEDEHDCFADTTHRTLFNNQQGIRNVLEGQYQAAGHDISGPSILGWLEMNEPSLAMQLREASQNASQKIGEIYHSGESGVHFDQLIGPGNRQGAMMINAAIQSLVGQTSVLVDTGAALGMTSFAPDTAGHF